MGRSKANVLGGAAPAAAGRSRENVLGGGGGRTRTKSKSKPPPLPTKRQAPQPEPEPEPEPADVLGGGSRSRSKSKSKPPPLPTSRQAPGEAPARPAGEDILGGGGQTSKKKAKPPPLPESSSAAESRGPADSAPAAEPAAQPARRPAPPALPTDAELIQLRQTITERRARESGGSPREATPEQRQVVHSMFASLDEDHTGRLSRSEVRAAFAAQSGQEPEDSRLDNAIAIFDADGDGEIDEQEFEELYEAVMAPEPSRCAVCNGWTLLLAVSLSAAVFILSSLSCCATDGTDAVQSPITGQETIDVR